MSTCLRWVALLLAGQACVAAAEDLVLRISESSINQAIAAAIDAHALGLSGYEQKWNVDKWWFGVTAATLDLRAGNEAQLDVTAHAQGNISIKKVISFGLSGNGRAAITGTMGLRANTLTQQEVIFTPSDLQVIRIDVDQFPGFIDSFFEDVLKLLLGFTSPLPATLGLGILPGIPSNKFVSTTPGLTLIDDEVHLTLSPKVARPNLVISRLGSLRVSDGYVFEFRVEVQNLGGVKSPSNVSVTLFDGNPDANGDHVIDSPLPPGVMELGERQTLRALGVNDTALVMWRASLTNGNAHTLHAVVDPEGLIRETSEADNNTSLVVGFVHGDLDGNRCIDRKDLTIMMAAITAHSKDLSLDLNGDAKLDVADARKLTTLFSNRLGAACS